jgi:hypothetical protein
MKRIITIVIFCFTVFPGVAATVDSIAAKIHNGQVFIIWKNIPSCDSGFYYVYKNTVPITDSFVFKASQYVGRIPFNFGLDYRFTQVINDGTKYYLIYDDTTQIRANQNLYVRTATDDGVQYYYAVRCDFGQSYPNWNIVNGGNSTLVKVKDNVQPVKAYLQKKGVFYNQSFPAEKMDAYIHYGGNTFTGNYPSMTNEGCLPFHFGIVKTGDVGGMNACYLKFHGGGGDFLSNAIITHLENSWKISFDDWIPAFNLDPNGANTRWLGYHENMNIYTVSMNSPPPISGIVRAYTQTRVKWELNWILSKWNTDSYTTLDTSRMYLVGTSQGCAGAICLTMAEPWKYAATSLTVPKYNLMAPEDDNPDCKFNDGSTTWKQTRVMFGDRSLTNLFTDIPILPGTGTYFRIYDIANTNYTLQLRRNFSLPFMTAINGKNDDITCCRKKFQYTIQYRRLIVEVSGNGI